MRKHNGRWEIETFPKWIIYYLKLKFFPHSTDIFSITSFFGRKSTIAEIQHKIISYSSNILVTILREGYFIILKIGSRKNGGRIFNRKLHYTISTSYLVVSFFSKFEDCFSKKRSQISGVYTWNTVITSIYLEINFFF